jgi:pSer/pThr/pTyr-binding forkhead associated (FHA) protein
MGARLEVVAGKAAGTSIVVEDELLIGRHAEGPGRLAEDDEISRSHARIALDGSGFCAIEDLGSTNGTFVNGLRVSAPQTLTEGDTIEVGATTIVVRELPGPVEEPTIRQPTAVGLRHDGGVPLPPTLSLQLEVDFAAREARLFVDEQSDPVRLVFDAGAWRSAPPIEKGGHA